MDVRGKKRKECGPAPERDGGDVQRRVSSEVHLRRTSQRESVIWMWPEGAPPALLGSAETAAAERGESGEEEEGREGEQHPRKQPEALVDSDGDLDLDGLRASASAATVFSEPAPHTSHNDTPSEQQLVNAVRIRLEHELDTQLDEVGLQLWMGSFLLCDFLLAQPSLVQSAKSIVELGCGVGLVGVVLSLLVPGRSKDEAMPRDEQPPTPRVVLTDYRSDILRVCDANLDRNLTETQRRHVSTVLWDWTGPSPLGNSQNEMLAAALAPTNCSLEQGELVLLGADVVYDDDLTEMLVGQLLSLQVGAKAQMLIFLCARTHDVPFPGTLGVLSCF